MKGQRQKNRLAGRRLAGEKSPYLLQHASNPVDWYPWGNEAFEKARREDRPIFLSIGYSSCHWCHVMERESFEDEEIARLLNENFVSIKVDREERPEIDQIYMSAVHAMTGSGGWPLSVFLGHDLEPFWGGTYFPPEGRWGRPGFREILLEIARLWKEEREKVVSSGREVADGLKSIGRRIVPDDFHSIEVIFDPVHGGFGSAPEFPCGDLLSQLFRIYRTTGEKKALFMAAFTLDRMARGGIYDHLGGGFHRYATDAAWLVPHFEKMLYDNALLARLYLEGYEADRNPVWDLIARETLDYILSDMTSPEGGFYSAQDADSEGVEGKYYLWSEEEIRAVLSVEEFEKVKEVFQITAAGNFEGKNILHLPESVSWDARREAIVSSARRRLLRERQKRVPPQKDDKVIASWNGLAIGAFAFASRVLGEERYLAAAARAADFILERMWDGEQLKRRYRAGEAAFCGTLDDYSFVVQALLDLYEAGAVATPASRRPASRYPANDRWFETAEKIQKKTDELFWDEKEGDYFFTDAGDPSLIVRPKEVRDGALPPGSSVAIQNRLRLENLRPKSPR